MSQENGGPSKGSSKGTSTSIWRTFTQFFITRYNSFIEWLSSFSFFKKKKADKNKEQSYQKELSLTETPKQEQPQQPSKPRQTLSPDIIHEYIKTARSSIAIAREARKVLPLASLDDSISPFTSSDNFIHASNDILSKIEREIGIIEAFKRYPDADEYSKLQELLEKVDKIPEGVKKELKIIEDSKKQQTKANPAEQVLQPAAILFTSPPEEMNKGEKIRDNPPAAKPSNSYEKPPKNNNG